MNKDTLIQGLSSKITNLAFKIEQNGPQIGFWGGLALLLGGSGLAVYRSCTKVPEIKREAEHEMAQATVKRMNDELEPRELDIQITRIKRAERRQYLKTFALPAGMVIIGATAQAGGFINLDKRYRQAGRDLAAITAAFAAYRKRTAERIGEDEERAIYYDADIEEITDEDGNVHKVLVNQNGPMPNLTFEFSPDTSDMCEQYNDMVEYLMDYLKRRESEWDNILQNDSVVWLNSILAALGLDDPENFSIRQAGWLNSKWYDVPEGHDHVEFNITPMKYIASDGRQRWKFVLNFNCLPNALAIAVSQKGNK